MLDIENFDQKFTSIINTGEFLKLQKVYNSVKHVFLFGHGGNMSIAEHAAIDASRLTDKNIQAPGGGVLVTSIQGDTNFNDWIMHWLEMRTRGIDKSDCLAIGFSCSTSGASSDCICTALNWAAENGLNCAMWAAQPKSAGLNEEVIQVIQNAKYYKKAKERRFETLGIESEIDERIKK